MKTQHLLIVTRFVCNCVSGSVVVYYCAPIVLLGVFSIFFTILIVSVLLVCCLPNSFIILKVHTTQKREKFKNWPTLLEKKQCTYISM